jgi:hypothetical protein
LKSQNSFTASESSDGDVDNNTAWVSIQESIRISAKETLGCYELKQHNHGLMKDIQNYWIKGNNPDCKD